MKVAFPINAANMLTRSLQLLFAFMLNTTFLFAAPAAGFFLPDNVHEISFRFKTINNLIILPVKLNDSIMVNLVLDTGCRNLVLFGKKFKNLINKSGDKEIQFSGLGKGTPVAGYLSLENNVSFHEVTGKRIPIIVVPQRTVFLDLPKIDGVIGYEIFSKFEVEINFGKQTITFRSAMQIPNEEFTLIPIRIEDSRPLIRCEITFSEGHSGICDLLIDTGSCLGLLYTTPDKKQFTRNAKYSTLGRGINGLIEGSESTVQNLSLGKLNVQDLRVGIIFTSKHYASLGTGFLKDYILVLNYCKEYAGLKKISG